MGDGQEVTLAAQAVRDLLWAVNSPCLIDAQQSVGSETEDIAAGDIDVGELLEFLNPATGHRVGRYFERLIHFYLYRIRRFEILVQGLQIQRDGRTIGELDFVFRDHAGALHHWETAVKFYLYRAAKHSSGSHLVGPNPADQFESKLSRMLNHQLPLSDSVFPDITIRYPFVKGRIFYHVNLTADSVGTLPSELALDHLRGSWCYESEIDCLHERHADAQTRVRVLTKPHWLADDRAEFNQSDCETMEANALRVRYHFQHSESPMLLSVLEPHESRQQETDRVFVVANSWPGE